MSTDKKSPVTEGNLNDLYPKELVNEMCEDVMVFFNAMGDKYNKKLPQSVNVSLHMIACLFNRSVLEIYSKTGGLGIPSYLSNHNNIIHHLVQMGLQAELIPPKDELS